MNPTDAPGEAGIIVSTCNGETRRERATPPVATLAVICGAVLLGTAIPALAVSVPQPGGPNGQLPWLNLSLFVAASVGGLYAVTKAAGALSSPLLVRIIYLAFFGGIFLFAYRSYAGSAGNHPSLNSMLKNSHFAAVIESCRVP